MKKITWLIFLASSMVFAQKEISTQLGQTTLDELKMTTYDKDSTAAAVVLYEHANVYLDNKHDYNIRTDYYYRIKILDKNSFDLATITIDLFKKKKAISINAITYNLTEIGTKNKTHLQKEKIYSTRENDNWSSKKFTMPNIKVGSVIEYSYSIISPYLSIADWNFQSDIPKIKSEFNASILGNYKYNLRLVGALKLDKNDSFLDKECIYIEGAGQGQCMKLAYGMNNIPAFKEENYMLSKKSFIARISFDLESYTDIRGKVTKYTTTWKQADRKLKSIFFNNQTSKKSFFKSRLPEAFFKIPNSLERAKKIYYHLQHHFSWNGKFWTSQDAKVKQAFKNQTGSAGEINLALYNSLKAAKLAVDLVILSTRNHGIPIKLYPVIFDFNYVIVKVNIDGKSYFLDATNKFLPFGQVPVRCLNGEARIINHNNENNWIALNPKYPTYNRTSGMLVLTEDGNLNGNISIIKNGYFGISQRKIIASQSEDDYLQKFESNNPDITVENYSVINEENLEKPIQENFKVNISMNEELANISRINPFLFIRVSENPFKLKERNYPVDFGYARKNNFLLNLQIPNNYKVKQLPKNFAISLPNNGGLFILKSNHRGSSINIYVRMHTNKRIYTADEYYALKEFFKRIIIAEEAFIVLEKM